MLPSGPPDQAVNSLCDIWHPDDIPAVFRTSSRTAFSGPTAGDVSQSEPLSVIQTQFFQHTRNIQLPSPVSPFTQTSPFCPALPTATSCAAGRGSNPSDRGASRSNQLLPLKGFVHEVLRRSRTSTGVLQIALCYLEAVRGKIPDLLRKEQSKTAGCDHEEVEERIVIATDLELELESGCSPVFDKPDVPYDLEFARLVGLPEPLTAPPSRLSSTMSTSSSSSSSVTSSTKRPSPPLSPLPLPSSVPAAHS